MKHAGKAHSYWQQPSSQQQWSERSLPGSAASPSWCRKGLLVLPAVSRAEPPRTQLLRAGLCGSEGKSEQ